jgi:threonyl-tRNA synthetase
MAIVGDREIESGSVNLRVRDGGEQLPIKVDALLERLGVEARPPI